jgi:hypothetical protein
LEKVPKRRRQQFLELLINNSKTEMEEEMVYQERALYTEVTYAMKMYGGTDV